MRGLSLRVEPLLFSIFFLSIMPYTSCDVWVPKTDKRLTATHKRRISEALLGQSKQRGHIQKISDGLRNNDNAVKVNGYSKCRGISRGFPAPDVKLPSARALDQFEKNLPDFVKNYFDTYALPNGDPPSKNDLQQVFSDLFQTIDDQQKRIQLANRAADLYTKQAIAIGKRQAAAPKWWEDAKDVKFTSNTPQGIADAINKARDRYTQLKTEFNQRSGRLSFDNEKYKELLDLRRDIVSDTIKYRDEFGGKTAKQLTYEGLLEDAEDAIERANRDFSGALGSSLPPDERRVPLLPPRRASTSSVTAGQLGGVPPALVEAVRRAKEDLENEILPQVSSDLPKGFVRDDYHVVTEGRIPTRVDIQTAADRLKRSGVYTPPKDVIKSYMTNQTPKRGKIDFDSPKYRNMSIEEKEALARALIIIERGVVPTNPPAIRRRVKVLPENQNDNPPRGKVAER